MAHNQLLLPDTKEIAHLLTFLLGRDVRVGASGRVGMGPSDRFTVGLYVNEHGQPIGAVATDLAAASWMGAALSLFPAHTTKEMILAGRCDESLWANTLEVYNVVSKFYHDCFDGMITLGPAYSRAEDVPADVRAFLRGAKKRLDVRVDVQGYGGGYLALLGAA